MEPITIIGLLSTAGALTSEITITIKSLSELRQRYKDADVRVRLLIGELSTVKSALTQINDWTHYLDDTHRQADVVQGLKISLEGCQLAIDALSEEVRLLLGGESPNLSASPGFRLRARYAWSESGLKEHEGRLHAQTAALQLLLQAVQWRDSSSSPSPNQRANDFMVVTHGHSNLSSSKGPRAVRSYRESLMTPLPSELRWKNGYPRGFLLQ